MNIALSIIISSKFCPAGIASTTAFIVSCFGWKEWKPENPDAPLRYGFRLKLPSAERAFPFAYGYRNTTDPTTFPVGEATYFKNYNNGFQLDIVVLIFDSVNDPRYFTTFVRVKWFVL